MTEKSQETENKSHTKLWLVLAGLIMAPVIGLSLILFSVIALLGADSESQASDCNAPGLSANGAANPGSGGNDQVPGKIREEQIKNAKAIDAAAADVGLSGKASRIAIITAVGESTLLNIDHGDEGAGVKNPDGSATTSKGLFQQQISTGWGTKEQVTDPDYATKSFLLGKDHKGNSPALVAIPGWEDADPTNTIHQVQGNADPGHYKAYYSEADAVIKEAGINVDRPADESKQQSWKSNAAKANDGAKKNDQSKSSGCGDAGKGKAGKNGDGKDSYPWPAPGPDTFEQDPMGFFYGECTSYASWKINESLGGSKDNIIFNNSVGGQKGNGAEWKSAWEAAGWEVSTTPKAGSVAWWGPNGAEGIGPMGHVAWVDEVTDDGKVVISEYNNAAYSPPGHKYDKRPQPEEANKVNAYLYPPSKEQLNGK